MASLGMTFQYDVEGRLSKAFQTGAPLNGGTYGYDAMGRLVSRTVTKTTAPTSTTTLYAHDINDHIIAETSTAGVTLREYIWLDDLPVAVVDRVDTASPALYYVHTDHLGRPVRMIAQNWAWVWDVFYAPFGAVSYIWSAPGVTQDMRFPGQWFQLESGLAYNWHRHYDASTGRYVQPDPLLKDNGVSTIGGIAADGLEPSVGFLDLLNWGQNKKAMAALSAFSKRSAGNAVAGERTLFADGPSLYGYATQNPQVRVDSNGLMSTYPYTPRPGAPTQKCYANDNESRGDRCGQAYYACLSIRGFNGRRACGGALDNCNAGLATIFAPGLIVP